MFGLASRMCGHALLEYSFFFCSSYRASYVMLYILGGDRGSERLCVRVKQRPKCVQNIAYVHILNSYTVWYSMVLVSNVYVRYSCVDRCSCVDFMLCLCIGVLERL